MSKRVANPTASNNKPAAGAPANAALARRPAAGASNDAMLSDTYVNDNDDMGTDNVNDELDDFEARLNGVVRSGATNNSNNKPAAKRSAAVGQAAAPQPKRAPPPMRPTHAPVGTGRGGPGLTEEELERREEVREVADLPDYESD